MATLWHFDEDPPNRCMPCERHQCHACMPFFNVWADDGVLYGPMGCICEHEEMPHA